MSGLGRRILVPVEGSALSAWVLERGAALFRQGASSVTLLGVEAQPGDEEASLEEARERLLALGVDARTERRSGDPADAILKELREGGYDLVAMTTHGRSGLGRVLFGSVALRVLQGATAPLLLFRPLQRADGTLSPVETHASASFRRVLALLDGSSAAEQVLGPAADLARNFEGELRLFTAVPGGPEQELHRAAAEERLGDWARRLVGGKLRTSFAVRHGPAAAEALAEAKAWGADVVALSTHGRTGAARALYGSVAERILREAATPLLVVRNRIFSGSVPAEAAARRM